VENYDNNMERNSEHLTLVNTCLPSNILFLWFVKNIISPCNAVQTKLTSIIA